MYLKPVTEERMVRASAFLERVLRQQAQHGAQSPIDRAARRTWAGGPRLDALARRVKVLHAALDAYEEQAWYTGHVAPGRLSTCPACGFDKYVQITPSTPGPRGWARRCKRCGHRWSLDFRG